jgi:hypothetical protein
VQRDHRLRRLLAAFVPPRSNHPSVTEGSLSRYPPALLTGVFELWGAVWMVDTLRRHGFTDAGQVEVEWSAGGLLGARWTLQHPQGVRLVLDYEPDPVRVQPEAAPPVHERKASAFAWAARQRPLDAARPFVAATEAASPDYLLRITTPMGPTLLVGDASLTDPRFPQGGTRKTLKVADYVRTIAWETDAGLVRCHPLGGFVLFTPPQKAWADLEGEPEPKAREVTICAPAVTGDHHPATVRFMHLVSRGCGVALVPSREAM